MAKTDKRTDTVKTGVFPKLVRIPIDAEETKKRKIQVTDLEMQIDDLGEKLKPTKEKITAMRAEKRKLKTDIKSGTTEEQRDVYEIKHFKRGEAVIFLAGTDEEVGRRTMEKADLQADVEEQAAE